MFYALPNLSSQEVRKIENPWSEPEAPADLLSSDKTTFGSWCTDPLTKHCFFNMAEGMDPLRRISDREKNRVVCLHGFVADIDREIPDQHFSTDYIFKRCGNLYVPNYASRTHSNNGRLVWMFEVPVNVPNQESATAFLKYFYNKVKVKKIWGAADDASFKPNQYFERGREWISVSNDRIGENELMYWLFESGRDVKFTDEESDLRLSMEAINDRFHALYPDKWPGKLEEGARGPAFWRDTRSGNSAVVRRGGIQDFGGEFRSWSSLLGYEWVSKVHGERIGSSIKSFWTDEQSYYFFDETNPGPVKKLNQIKLERKLKVEMNFSTTRPDGKSFSELDEVIKRIDERVVTAVGPFIHFRPGPLLVGGKLYLNSSIVRPLPPAPEPEGHEGRPIPFGLNFPYISKFLTHLFPKDKSGRYPLEYFLSVLRYKYVNALNFTPVRTHALVLTGPRDSGKTMLIEGIAAPLLGDPRMHNPLVAVREDSRIFKSIVGQPFAYAVGRTNHNDGLAEYPVWSYDDEKVRNDKEHDDFTNFVKQTAALGSIRFNPKHSKEFYSIWRGLQFSACNEDGQSARQLPNMDTSTLDKIQLFRVNNGFEFLPEAESVKRLSIELPHFARWLVNWKIPPHCIGKARFGVIPYHDPHLLRMAYENGANYEFSEMLGLFLRNFQDQKKANGEDVTEWVGSSSQLVVELGNWNTAAARLYNGRSIGRSLKDLMNRGLNIRVSRKSQSRTYYIPVELSFASEDSSDDQDYEIVPLSDEDLDKLHLFK